MHERNPRAWNALGVVWMRLDQPAKALEAWARCLNYDPKQYDALYNTGPRGRTHRGHRARAARPRALRRDGSAGALRKGHRARYAPPLPRWTRPKRRTDDQASDRFLDPRAAPSPPAFRRLLPDLRRPDRRRVRRGSQGGERSRRGRHDRGRREPPAEEGRARRGRPRASSSRRASSTSTTTRPTSWLSTPLAPTQVSQGITTVVQGPGRRARRGRSGTIWRAARRRPAAVNVMTMVGHATIRQLVMGEDLQARRDAEEAREDGGARRTRHARGRGRPFDGPRVRGRQLQRDRGARRRCRGRPRRTAAST